MIKKARDIKTDSLIDDVLIYFLKKRYQIFQLNFNQSQTLALFMKIK